MATPEQALAKMREICLALPDTSEGSHFQDIAFKVKGRLFATCGDSEGAWRIIFGLEPDHAKALTANDARFKRYPRDRRGVMLEPKNVKSWDEVRQLIAESYHLVAPRKSPMKKAASSKAPRAKTTRRKTR